MTNFKIKFSQIYLSLVPVLTIVLALAVGYISYKIYLPIWVINVLLMIFCTWNIGGHVLRTGDATKKYLAVCAVFFIVPTILTSMFFGLGAPPFESPKAWVASITEQQIRYYYLLSAGLFISFGFAMLRQYIKNKGENLYSLLGDTAIKAAIPIFFINMTFWGFYLTKLYQGMVKSNTEKNPEWLLPIGTQFFYINVIVTALFYLGTAAFIISLRRIGLFRKTASNIYVFLSLLFFLFDVLPPTLPEPFATLNFIVSIPAVPFFFAYFMGINLLRKISDYRMDIAAV